MTVIEQALLDAIEVDVECMAYCYGGRAKVDAKQTIAYLREAGWEIVRSGGAVGLTPEIAAVAATLVDLAKRDLPPHISEAEQAEAYLALRRIAGGQ